MLDHLSFDELLTRRDNAARAEVAGRLLWPLLALLIPLIAYVLGKPPRRSSSASGIFVGAILIVLIVRSTSFVKTADSNIPEGLAISILIVWITVTTALLIGEAKIGNGFLDTIINRWPDWIIRLSRSRNYTPIRKLENH